MSETLAVSDAKNVRLVTNVVCPFCGVVCDDLEIRVENGKIKTVKNACALGKATYLHYEEGLEAPRLYGQPATMEQCIDTAGKILAKSKNPLIYGLDSTELSAQRKAIELADLIGANIDHTSSV